jgi:hypothetical protein
MSMDSTEYQYLEALLRFSFYIPAHKFVNFAFSNPHFTSFKDFILMGAIHILAKF